MGPILSTTNETSNIARIDPNCTSISSHSLEDHIDMSYAMVSGQKNPQCKAFQTCGTYNIELSSEIEALLNAVEGRG